MYVSSFREENRHIVGIPSVIMEIQDSESDLQKEAHNLV